MADKLGNFNEILKEDLINDLEWLIEEFEFLFDSKMGNHTEMDKKFSNDVYFNFSL